MAELKISYDEHFALIVGINEYKNLNNLEYAVNDAKAIYSILKDKFSYKEENMKLILDKEANKENIMNAYYEMAKNTCNDDTLIVFYAGHGSTYQAGLKDKGYLIPYDETEQNLNTLISWNSLTTDSDLFRAKHIFYIIDACYSGLALQRSGGGSKRFLKDMLRRYSRQVLTAGKSDQTVKDSGGKNNNSIFTSYLLDALNGEAKTEYGVLSASSIMNYVYTKVSNDPKSTQTPGYGSFYGEGDFIFNFDEINDKIGKNSEKDRDILIDVPQTLRIESDNNAFTNNLKNLLSDSKNYIKVNDLINNELKIYITEFDKEKLELSGIDENKFKIKIKTIEKNIKNLLIAVVLITYYGDERYNKILKKIISRVFPTGTFSGQTIAISLLYIPALILIYGIIITALESEKYDVLKEIINMKDNKIDTYHYYRDTDSLITSLFNRINEVSSSFKCLFPDQNYKYPMNEYLYKYLQPIIDDILYIGDEYSDRYTNAEILISIAYAIKNYNDKDYVWGPTGRYLYILGYGNKDINKLPINDVILKLGLYSEISNKDDFITKYNNFISTYFF